MRGEPEAGWEAEETGGGSRRAPGPARGGQAEEVENWGKMGKGRAGHSSGESAGWRVRVVGCWKLVCVTGARRGCENSLFRRFRAGGGRAAWVEDGASGRAETGRVSGTL